MDDPLFNLLKEKSKSMNMLNACRSAGHNTRQLFYRAWFPQRLSYPSHGVIGHYIITNSPIAILFADALGIVDRCSR